MDDAEAGSKPSPQRFKLERGPVVGEASAARISDNPLEKDTVEADFSGGRPDLKAMAAGAAAKLVRAQLDTIRT